MTCPHSDTLDNLSWLRDDRRLLGGSWRCRACSRERAHARRGGYWCDAEGMPLKPCASSESYRRYENSIGRVKQRMWYPRYGAGAHKLTREEFKAATRGVFAAAVESLLGQG